MKTLAFATVAVGSVLISAHTAWCQTPVAGTARTSVTATCPSGKVIPVGTPIPDEYLNDPQTYFCGTSTAVAPAANMNQAIANAEAGVILNLIGGLLSSNKNDAEARNRATAAAAAAEEQREAEAARQQALEERKRQEMFDRLSRSLKLSGLATLSLKGFDNNPDLQLKGFGDVSTNEHEDLQLKGFSDQPVAANTSAASAPLGPQTCFFGECGPSGSGPIEPWGDPKVVDLRDLQQGVDLAAVATKAPPADRQMIMDQALAAANADPSVQVNLPTDSTVPVTSEQGLLAFQQANSAYRQAHDSAYQLQQAYNQIEAQRQGVYSVIKAEEQQLEADLGSHLDDMSLAEKEAAMAKIYDAMVREDAAYGKTWSQYTAAREQYYQERYALQMYLWNTALGKQGLPPNPPVGLIQSVAENPGTAHVAPPASDLSLVLPPVQPVIAPTKDDLKLLEKMEIEGFPHPPDPLTQKVVAFLQQEEMQENIVSNRIMEGGIEDLQHQQEAAARLSTQPSQVFPPKILNQYHSNPQFQQQMNAEHQRIFVKQQESAQDAVRDADNEWSQKIAQLQSRGLIQPGVPLAQQAQTNPQLRAQLDSIQKQVTSELDYKVTHAQFEAEKSWQQWIEDEEAKLPMPTLTTVGAVRD